MKRERMVILLFAVLLAAIPVVPALLLSQHTPKSESESAAEQSKAADDLPDFSVLDGFHRGGAGSFSEGLCDWGSLCGDASNI